MSRKLAIPPSIAKLTMVSGVNIDDTPARQTKAITYYPFRNRELGTAQAVARLSVAVTTDVDPRYVVTLSWSAAYRGNDAEVAAATFRKLAWVLGAHYDHHEGASSDHRVTELKMAEALLLDSLARKGVDVRLSDYGPQRSRVLVAALHGVNAEDSTVRNVFSDWSWEQTWGLGDDASVLMWRGVTQP